MSQFRLPDAARRVLVPLFRGSAPALTALLLVALAELIGQPAVAAYAYASFGFLTPVITANAKRRATAVVAIVIASGFLVQGIWPVDGIQFNAEPWWLFAWGLFPGIAVSLVIRVWGRRPRLIPYLIPAALLIAGLIRMLLPDVVLVPVAFLSLAVDVLILWRVESQRKTR